MSLNEVGCMKKEMASACDCSVVYIGDRTMEYGMSGNTLAAADSQI